MSTIFLLTATGSNNTFNSSVQLPKAKPNVDNLSASAVCLLSRKLESGICCADRNNAYQSKQSQVWTNGKYSQQTLPVFAPYTVIKISSSVVTDQEKQPKNVALTTNILRRFFKLFVALACVVAYVLAVPHCMQIIEAIMIQMERGNVNIKCLADVATHITANTTGYVATSNAPSFNIMCMRSCCAFYYSRPIHSDHRGIRIIKNETSQAWPADAPVLLTQIEHCMPLMIRLLLFSVVLLCGFIWSTFISILCLCFGILLVSACTPADWFVQEWYCNLMECVHDAVILIVGWLSI